MISASLVSKVGVRAAVNGPPSQDVLRERAARLGIVLDEPTAAQQAGQPSFGLAQPVGLASRAPQQQQQYLHGAGSSVPGRPVPPSSAAAPSWMVKQEEEEAPPQQVLRPRAPGVHSGPSSAFLASASRAAAAPPAPARLLTPKLSSVKEELPDRPDIASSSLVNAIAVKAEAGSVRVKSELEVQREMDADHLRQKAAVRDLACKAICAIKHGLRRMAKVGRQSFKPKDWDAEFQPHLGAYFEFLCSRPDQFRVVEGSVAGKFDIQNVASNITVVAKAWRRGDRLEVKLEEPSAASAALSKHGPRDRIDGGTRVQGEVTRWCGGFGWLRPAECIDHPCALKHNGDVFVHASDVIGALRLDPGAKVEFIVYVDKSGLGAEECRLVPKAGSAKVRPAGSGKGAAAAGAGKGGGAGKGKGGKGGKSVEAALSAMVDKSKEKSAPGSDASTPTSYAAEALRGALPPLRLTTSPCAGPQAVVKPKPEEEEDPEEQDEALDEAEEGKDEQDEEDDDIEGLGFVIEGGEDAADEDEPEEADDVDALGFTVDGAGEDAADGDAGGCPTSDPYGAFDVWSLLTADDEEPAGSQAQIVDASGRKRPLAGPGAAAAAAKRARG